METKLDLTTLEKSEKRLRCQRKYIVPFSEVTPKSIVYSVDGERNEILLNEGNGKTQARFPHRRIKTIGFFSEKEVHTQAISGVGSSPVCQSFCLMFTDPFSFWFCSLRIKSCWAERRNKILLQMGWLHSGMGKDMILTDLNLLNILTNLHTTTNGIKS